MAAYLPIELVGEIWRVAAELFIETEHRTVLNIAAACTIGYHAAIPVIYRTLLMTHDGAELVMRIFNTDFISGSPTLSASPAQRLCPLVRRLCAFKVPDGLNTDDLKYLTGLEMIWDSLDSFLLAPLAPTLTHLFVYTTNWPQWIPSTLTHVSIYCFFGSDWEVRRNKLMLIFNDLVSDPSHCMRYSCRVSDSSEVCVCLASHVYNCSGGAIGVFPQLLFPSLQVCNLPHPPLLINSPQLLFPSLQAITSSTGYEPRALGTSPIIALLPPASACARSTPHLAPITFDLRDLCIILVDDTLSAADLTI